MIVAIVAIVSLESTAQSLTLSETKYDYSQVAAQITADCSSNYDKAKAIYRWLAANIAYDTSYSIYTADECWEQKRGVCQAYCELFSRLAEGVGMKVYVIAGKSKDTDGNISSMGHAWLFVVTSGESTGILVDPTWGAGSVDKGRFIRSDNDMSWFDVRPEWMIFSHFPDGEQWQLLDRPLSMEEFARIPSFRPYLASYGIDGADLLAKSRAGQVVPPQFFNSGVGKVALFDIPMQPSLRVGGKYRFEIGLYGDYEIALINGGNYLNRSNWRIEGNHLVADYVPQEAGEASLSVKDGDGMYYAVVNYTVPEPTAADLSNLEQLLPEAMPELKRLKNYDSDMVKAVGIDVRSLLSAARRGEVQALPKIYRYDGFQYRVVEAPLSETLQVGQTYTFTVKASSPWLPAAITPDGWVRDWQTDEAGTYTVTITPKTSGELKISADYLSDGKYYALLSYQVR